MKSIYKPLVCAILLFSSGNYTFAEEIGSAKPTDKEPIAESHTPSPELGKITFDTICSHCHLSTYDESSVGAPGLRGVLDRHDERWLNQWIKSPEKFSQVDEAAKALVSSNKFGLVMPTIPAMQDDDARADIIAYLKTLK